MKYMLLLFGSDDRFAALPKQNQADLLAGFELYVEALKAEGAYVDGGRLESAAQATTVVAAGSDKQILDGPFIESREQLGGYFVIEAADRAQAHQWALRCPGVALGAIEVRQLGSS